MRITTRVDSGVAILAVSGRLTIGEGDVALRQAIVGVLDAGRTRILIDLEGCTYMDSAGLGELVRAKATATARGATLKLLHVEDRVRKVLLLTRVIGVFEIFDDEGAALVSFR